MAPIRIGIIEFLNTRPLIAGLEHTEGVELIPAVPSALASMVASGRVDLALVSLVDAVAGDEPLAIIPAGMIGCDGPTMTVGLFSRVGFDRATTLAADTHSHTSVVLARLILDRVMGTQPEVVALDAGAIASPTDWPETVLLIGDKVLDGAPPESTHPHRLDLGSAWKTLTGKPFVYAAWMCRPERAHDDAITAAARLLDHQLRHNLTRLDHIAASWARQHDWPVERAKHYLTTLLRYRLDASARDAAEHFIGLAAASSLVASRPLVWADTPALVGPAGDPSD